MLPMFILYLLPFFPSLSSLEGPTDPFLLGPQEKTPPRAPYTWGREGDPQVDLSEGRKGKSRDVKPYEKDVGLALRILLGSQSLSHS